MANVVIDIAAEFTGNKAFRQAETSTDKLIRGVKKLAAATGLAFGTAQVIAFGKASVKAALDAQAQQQRLANLVKVTVGATDAQIQSLNDQAQALQEIGVVNKENITQTQSQLATFNLQIDTIKALTPAILDYVTAEKGAAASADEFKSMTNGLAQALNGNFASLTKVGFVLDDVTKKTIKNGTEAERAAALVAVLDSTYKDFNKNLALTDAGQMQILANAADDAAENIGVGLIDALKTLGKDNSVENLANDMERASLGAADFIRGLAEITSFEVNGQTKSLIGLLTTPFKRSLSAGPLGAIARMGVKTGDVKAADNAHLKSLQDQFVVIKKTNEVNKKLTADELKKLKAAKLKLAIDKANLALGKGEEIFDLDKIQVAAALTNQAELLGKTTNASQILGITNDVARLNVKKAILELEDALATKDETAITAATKKLNEELKILNAVSQQNIKLLDIKTVLDSLKAKDLINLDNLNAAIALLTRIGTMGIAGSTTTSITSDAAAQATAILAARTAAEKAAAEAAKAAEAAAKATLEAANTAAAAAAAKAKAEADAALAAANALTAEEKARADAAAGASAAAIATANALAAEEKARADAIAAAAAEQIAQLEAARIAAEAYAAALQEAADAAAAVADAVGTDSPSAIQADNSPLATVISETGKEVTKLAEGLATVFQTVEDSGAFNALVNSFANGAVGSFSAGSFRTAEGGSLFNSGAVGSRDRDINITVNTGVGDPNAIAEAIQNVLRDANARGTLVGLTIE